MKLKIAGFAILCMVLLVLDSCARPSGPASRDFGNSSSLQDHPGIALNEIELKRNLFIHELPGSDTSQAQEILQIDNITYWVLKDLGTVCLGAAVQVNPADTGNPQVTLGRGETLVAKCLPEDLFLLDGIFLNAVANEFSIDAFLRSPESESNPPTNFKDAGRGLYLTNL